jgi:hypothetical protein
MVGGVGIIRTERKFCPVVSYRSGAVGLPRRTKHKISESLWVDVWVQNGGPTWTPIHWLEFRVLDQIGKLSQFISSLGSHHS